MRNIQGLFSIALLLSSSTMAFAVVEDDLSDLRDLPLNIQGLPSTLKKNKISLQKAIQRQRTTLEEIKKSPIMILHLAKGTPLWRVKKPGEKDEISSAPRSLLVRAYRHIDDEGFRYIVNHDGAVLYKVDVDHADDVRPVTQLSSDPTFFHAEAGRPKSTTELHWPSFSAALRLGFVPFESAFLSSLAESDSVAGIGTQIGLTAFASWAFPIEPGLSGRYLNASIASSYGRASYDCMSIGPAVRYAIARGNAQSFYGLLAVRQSATSTFTQQRTDETRSVRLSNLEGALALEWDFATSFYARTLVGIEYTRSAIRMKSSTTPIELDSGLRGMQSLGLYAGLGF